MKEKKPIMSCANSGHITKLKQSIFAPFDIYGLTSNLSLGYIHEKTLKITLFYLTTPKMPLKFGALVTG